MSRAHRIAPSRDQQPASTFGKGWRLLSHFGFGSWQGRCQLAGDGDRRTYVESIVYILIAVQQSDLVFEKLPTFKKAKSPRPRLRSPWQVPPRCRARDRRPPGRRLQRADRVPHAGLSSTSPAGSSPRPFGLAPRGFSPRQKAKPTSRAACEFRRSSAGLAVDLRGSFSGQSEPTLDCTGERWQRRASQCAPA